MNYKEAIKFIEAQILSEEVNYAGEWNAANYKNVFNRWFKELIEKYPDMEVEQISSKQWEAYNGRKQVGKFTDRNGGEIFEGFFGDFTSKVKGSYNGFQATRHLNKALDAQKNNDDETEEKELNKSREHGDKADAETFKRNGDFHKTNMSMPQQQQRIKDLKKKGLLNVEEGFSPYKIGAKVKIVSGEKHVIGKEGVIAEIRNGESKNDKTFTVDYDFDEKSDKPNFGAKSIQVKAKNIKLIKENVTITEEELPAIMEVVLAGKDDRKVFYTGTKEACSKFMEEP